MLTGCLGHAPAKYKWCLFGDLTALAAGTVQGRFSGSHTRRPPLVLVCNCVCVFGKLRQFQLSNTWIYSLFLRITFLQIKQASFDYHFPSLPPLTAVLLCICLDLDFLIHKIIGNDTVFDADNLWRCSAVCFLGLIFLKSMHVANRLRLSFVITV